MRELVEQLNRANYQYYVLDEPLISDAAWDALYDELKTLEEKENLVLPDSPTRRVGGEPLPAFVTHTHLNRLWSMDKVQSAEQLGQWFARVEQLHARQPGLPPLNYAVEYKYDGLTLNLTYREGHLVQAATRGNGITGEQVLAQALTIRGIPLSIPYKGLMEIHGECIMRLSVLARYNRTAAEPLKNARNAAAGALRNLDPRVTASRKLDARFYEVGTITNPPYTDQRGLNDFIRDNGFPVSPILYEGGEQEEVLAAISKVEAQREALDFLIDGVVIKVTDLETRRALGYTDKFPRWAVAFKFAAEEATTVLERVTWDVGRSGKLTPLAHVSPVDFAGVTVRRATLNNYGDIQRKRLTLGSTVFIRRSNDVIPEILGKVEDGIAGEEIEKPDTCPACGSALVETGAHLFCLNREGCKPQVIARLTHFCSREAMDIESLSEKTLEVLYEHLSVREPQDLYQLTADRLVGLPGFQRKKAEKVVEALNISRDCQLDAFLLAIGIPNIGRATARDLALHFGSLQALREAAAEQLQEVPEVGGVVAAGIVEFFADPLNAHMVDALLQAGVRPRDMAPQQQGGVFQGKTFVLTGTLPTLTRQQAEELIVRNGGTVSSSVSRKTSYLLLGENPGSKAQKAKELGIEAMDEARLLRSVNNQ
ncbi:MAG TPA: NAD-dependent DNA ligase LigA [Clostridia bacterium]|nr:NAD-dependent DNA ligase LigA [Clostridia bacterium]